MVSKYAKLDDIFRKKFHDLTPLILLHPDESGRNYTEEEFDHLKQRDFKTRLFIRSTSINGSSVSLRTHFTDNHKHESHLNYIRDYFKAALITNNMTSAKTALTELLSMFFAFNESQYCSFVVSAASGLSGYGKGISFENDIAMPQNRHDEEIACKKLCLLMDIIFSKVAMYRHLVNNEGGNTYRIVHCGTKGSRNKRPLFYAAFSFLLQLCLTGYVILENITSAHAMSFRNLPLAILTFIYSAMIAWPGITDSRDAIKLYGKFGLLQSVDYFVNTVLTLVLLFSGFFVIMIQESFIEAVLNTAALLFIPEIDDQLPQLLGLDEEAIIKNYLNYQSLKQFNIVMEMDEKTVDKELRKRKNKSIGVPFCDYYLTNIEEQAAYPEDGINFTPYRFKAEKNGNDGHQIDPSNFVTGSCLIRKLVWSYTTSAKYAYSSKPRIGYLRIEMMSPHNKPIEIRRKGVDDECQVSDVKHVLEGAFIITCFQMSDDIIRLRVCGSPNARDFLRALEYYSLWELNSTATSLLEAEASKMGSFEKEKARSNIRPDFDHYISMGRVASSASYDNEVDKKGGGFLSASKLGLV